MEGNIYDLKLKKDGKSICELILTKTESLGHGYFKGYFRNSLNGTNHSCYNFSESYEDENVLVIHSTLVKQYLYLKSTVKTNLVDGLKQVVMFDDGDEKVVPVPVPKIKQLKKKQDTQHRINMFLYIFAEYYPNEQPTQKEVAYYTGQTLRNVQRYYSGDKKNRFYHGYIREMGDYHENSF